MIANAWPDRRVHRLVLRQVLLLVLCGMYAGTASAQALASTGDASDDSRDASRTASTVRFLGGALAGFAAHEGGHLALDVVFDADPRLKRVDFHGIPFFAIAHRELSPRRELAVSSIGFWIQHAGSEWILTRDPDLRSRRAPLRKGILAFNVLTSAAYAGAAFARTGPAERDTRGIAQSARVDERWVGAMLLVPATLDAWRYYDPDAKWPVWVSRIAKAGMVFLVVR
jgi:hypothetical protein